MNITTIKELKEIIKDLPDDLPIVGFDGYDNVHGVDVASSTSENEDEDFLEDLQEKLGLESPPSAWLHISVDT